MVVDDESLPHGAANGLLLRGVVYLLDEAVLKDGLLGGDDLDSHLAAGGSRLQVRPGTALIKKKINVGFLSGIFSPDRDDF
jgi:hypothetical protein